MSNRESGDGFGDILIRIEDEDVGIVIEVKYADDGNLQGECEKALQQIIDIRYTEPDLNLRMSGRWKCRRSFCFIHKYFDDLWCENTHENRKK